ncbi:MAG: hypothetical protein V4622_09655 [Bacteroidota bacterium]
MLQIKYPTKNLIKFNDSYYDSIISGLDKTGIETILASSTGRNFTIKEILTSTLSDLIKIKNDIQTGIIPTEFIKLETFFEYKNLQPIIAHFFSTQNELILESCFYCNMDFIHSFKEYGDYENGLDLLNRGHEYELLKIPYVTENKLNNLRRRNQFNRPFNSIDDPNLDSRSKAFLRGFNPANIKNHFTLDHALPQSKYKLLSLSLFNFVPSCYACNAKFKKAKEFKTEADFLMASPSSSTFSIVDDFEFYLYFEGKIEDLKEYSKINLAERIIRNEPLINEYFKIFKIPGRYLIHKKEALRIIRLRNRYPQSKIEEIEKLTGASSIEIKRDLFGDEIFDYKETSKSLTKFKRDIARNLKIH